MSQSFGVIGFPWDGGASLGRPGARYGPKAIREAFQWFQNRIEGQQVYKVESRQLMDLAQMEIVDYGDIAIVSHSYKKTFQNAEADMHKMLSDRVFPIILGGDHSISYPMIKALHDRTNGEVGIIQFDAHLDLVDDSPIQGKYSQSSQMRRALELQRVKPEHVVQIGVRGYNYPWYHQYLTENAIVQITAQDVYETTLESIVEKTKNALKDVDTIYLTFDIDVLDPAFAPGAGANEPGGLTQMQCFTLLNDLYPIVDALDIAEVNPLYDPQNITSTIAAKVMFDCMTRRSIS